MRHRRIMIREDAASPPPFADALTSEGGRGHSDAVTGHYAGIIDLGGGPSTSKGKHDIFIARFTP